MQEESKPEVQLQSSIVLYFRGLKISDLLNTILFLYNFVIFAISPFLEFRVFYLLVFSDRQNICGAIILQ